ncbi:MAG: TraR/DksA C4-type zinc finger protein [Deltaproteobacteria bacterium]
MEKRANTSELTQQQRDQLQKQLLDAKEALTSRRSGQLRARTDLLSEVEDEGDAASRANSEDTLVSLAESEHARLAQIDRALAKFAGGEYGLDEETGEPIPFGRLAALPWARFAASTQEEHDRQR